MVYLFLQYLVPLQILREGKTGLDVMEIRLALSYLGKILNGINFWTLFYMSSISSKLIHLHTAAVRMQIYISGELLSVAEK